MKDNNKELSFHEPPNRGIENWTCFFIGHVFDKNINDGGYPICDRCNMHGYYDIDESMRAWPRMYDYPFWEKPLYRLVRKLTYFRSIYYRVKRHLFGKQDCVCCKKETLQRKWKSGKCPNCGVVDDLPF